MLQEEKHETTMQISLVVPVSSLVVNVTATGFEMTENVGSFTIVAQIRAAPVLSEALIVLGIEIVTAA